MSSHDLFAPHDVKAAGWSFEDASHLLRRAQFGATQEEIEQAVKLGLDQTVHRLINTQKESAEFIAAEPILRQTAIDAENIQSLKSWWLYRMVHSANAFAEKMTLFWHNHFATSNAKVESTQLMWRQNEMFRKLAIGDFKVMLLNIAKDPAMLIWLDGNGNKRRAPNENFARELLELFSLGVGNYTEKDIQEAARSFSGWHMRQGEYWFNEDQHDEGVKSVFGKRGNWNGDDVVKFCLDHKACPKFLASKLLKTFALAEPAAEITESFAKRIRAHNYDLSLIMSELFRSKLFYLPSTRNSVVKSPLELIVGSYRTLGVQPKLEPTIKTLSVLGQDVFEPPTVKGWEGGRQWINSAIILHRTRFAAELANGSKLGYVESPNQRIRERNLNSAERVVDFFSNLLIGRTFDASTRSTLVAFVRGSKKDADGSTRELIQLILASPEYQLV